MALHKAFAWMLSILILSPAISLWFAESPGACLPYVTAMIGDRAPSTASGTKVRKFGEDSTGTVIESARKVPTGPDPLHHHNKNPTGH